ncbi:MAG: hypothetical protein IT436_19025 [Phycisphaerales bacterium]|nr:hypothetical protein [Phycisphaerales bacterium]
MANGEWGWEQVMLVKFLDKDEKPVWVNPVHVRYLQAKGKGTMIVLGMSMYLRVTATPDEAAQALSEAMPDQVLLVPEGDDEVAAGS